MFIQFPIFPVHAVLCIHLSLSSMDPVIECLFSARRKMTQSLIDMKYNLFYRHLYLKLTILIDVMLILLLKFETL